MRIVGTSSSVSTLTRRSANAAADGAAPLPQGTALIAVEGPRRNAHAQQWAGQPSAAFVAHLLATRLQAPQTRARRRAEPEEAIAVYRSMTKPVPHKRVFGTRV